MTSVGPPDLLNLEPLGEGRYQVPMPTGSQEGLTVVFGASSWHR